MSEKEKSFYRQMISYYITQRQITKSSEEVDEINNILNGFYNVLYLTK